jgi:hypothetical protein
MEYVNSTDGHVQAGELVLIPTANRYSTNYIINDSSVPRDTGTWDVADLSSYVPPNTVAVYGNIMLYNDSDEAAVLNLRGYGETSTSDAQARSIGIYADEGGASTYVHIGTPALIYAPGGKFEYAWSSYAVDIFRFILWGYYVA